MKIFSCIVFKYSPIMLSENFFPNHLLSHNDKMFVAISALKNSLLSTANMSLNDSVSQSIVTKYLEKLLFNDKFILPSFNEERGRKEETTPPTSISQNKKKSEETSNGGMSKKSSLEMMKEDESFLDEELGNQLKELPTPQVQGISNIPQDVINLTIQALPLFYLLITPTERYINQICLLGLNQSNKLLAKAARDVLLKMPLSVRDDVVQGLVNALSNAEIDAPDNIQTF